LLRCGWIVAIVQLIVDDWNVRAVTDWSLCLDRGDAFTL
jgi:hypothetical protein